MGELSSQPQLWGGQEEMADFKELVKVVET